MTSKRVNIILAAALLLSMGLNAQFRHSALLDTVKETGFYSISVTPELASYLKTDLSDLRIIDEKKQWVPYITEAPFHKKSHTPVLFYQKVMLKENKDSQTNLVIENDEKIELSDLILELKNAAAERVGSLSGSDDYKNWFVILDSLMIRKSEEYSDTSHRQQINFPASTYKYFKLTVYNNKRYPLNILNVLTSAPESFLDTIPSSFRNPQPKFAQKDSGHYSLVTIMFEKPFQINGVHLRVSAPWFFKREAKLFTHLDNSLPATWSGISHDTLTMSSDDFSEHYIRRLKTDTLYVLIENGDNPPLQISSVTTSLINRNIIAHLEKGKSYSLLVDDPGARAPVYDLEHFKDRIHTPKLVSISNITGLQPEVIQAQTQNGRRWIWPVIILVIVVLGALTWKLASDMKKADTQ